MKSFLELLPNSENVVIRGQTFPVTAITIEMLGHLFMRFPEIKDALDQKKVKGSKTPTEIISLGVDAIAAIIAAGLGSLGDEKVEKIAKSLSIGEQTLFIQSIIRLTLPQGAGPFMDSLRALGILNSKPEAETELDER